MTSRLIFGIIEGKIALRLFYPMECLSIKERFWKVFQKEKLRVLDVLNQIAYLQDGASDDRERYLKMGLRLDPNNAKMNFRNEKDTILLYSSKMQRIKKLSQ